MPIKWRLWRDSLAWGKVAVRLESRLSIFNDVQKEGPLPARADVRSC